MFIKNIVAKKNVTINTGIDRYKLKIDDVRTLTFSDEKTYKGFVKLGLIKPVGKNAVSITKKEAPVIPVIRPANENIQTPPAAPEAMQDITVIESIQKEKQHNQVEPGNQDNEQDNAVDDLAEESASVGTSLVEKDFSNYTQEQLVELAKEAGIKRAATMKPETIIEKLKDI